MNKFLNWVKLTASVDRAAHKDRASECNWKREQPCQDSSISRQQAGSRAPGIYLPIKHTC